MDKRVFCSAQTGNWLMEILALVDESCALSTASAVTVPTGISNALGWLQERKPMDFHEYLPDECRTASTGMKFGVDSES